MTPDQLTTDELLALVGLMRHLAQADGEISPAETDTIQALGNELGGVRFTQAWGRARAQFETAQDALDYAAHHVTRRDARVLMVTLLHDLAQAGGGTKPEMQFVTKVRMMWGVF